MKKFLLSIGAAATLAAGFVATSVSTASADPWRGGYYRHGGYGGGWGGGGWRYGHHRGWGGGDALATGAIGLGVGALLGSALTSRPYSDDRFYGRGYYGNGYYGGGYYGRPGYVVDEPVYQERRVYYSPAPVYREYRPVRAYSPGYGHAEACAARYRTYDYQTDTYIARPGVVRRCQL